MFAAQNFAPERILRAGRSSRSSRRVQSLARSARSALLGPFFWLSIAAMLAMGGCARFHVPLADKYVYVTAKQAFLRDRVAAVSNRTGTVSNGDKLVVLEHARRFIKVRTEHGDVGWLEERLTADQSVADSFDDLRKQHEKNPVIAAATARDEVYLHLSPGRDTERFFRLAEGEGLSLIERASVVKAVTAVAAAAASAPKLLPRPASAKKAAGAPLKQTPAPQIAGIQITGTQAMGTQAMGAQATGPPPPVMEDWWLVRDTRGETGWIYSRMIDVTEPEALSRYSEGQRIVGAYVLTHVEDPGSTMMSNGQPVTSIPEYVTVLSPFKAGLPYDFDQVRVFIWNVKKHRYETGFRQRNVAGYLPVEIGEKKDPYSKQPNASSPLPAFTYHLLPADAAMPVPDPTTGLVKPSRTITKTLRLEGNICRRILPPGTIPPEEAHPVVEPEKEKGKHRRR